MEFDTTYGKTNIPFDAIESIEVLESDLKCLLKGDLKLKEFKPAIIFNWANFHEHIVLDKTEGFCKRFLFTSQNPKEFKKVHENALINFYEN